MNTIETMQQRDSESQLYGLGLEALCKRSQVYLCRR